jgi:hypothetical protein
MNVHYSYDQSSINEMHLAASNLRRIPVTDCWNGHQHFRSHTGCRDIVGNWLGAFWPFHAITGKICASRLSPGV